MKKVSKPKFYEFPLLALSVRMKKTWKIALPYVEKRAELFRRAEQESFLWPRVARWSESSTFPGK